MGWRLLWEPWDLPPSLHPRWPGAGRDQKAILPVLREDFGGDGRGGSYSKYIILIFNKNKSINKL